jgi:hypothetical protein
MKQDRVVGAVGLGYVGLPLTVEPDPLADHDGALHEYGIKLEALRCSGRVWRRL